MTSKQQFNPIAHTVTKTLDEYFESLGDEPPSEVHKMVLTQVEKPLIEYILKKTQNNQTEASKILGINRNTLRTKIKLYKL